MGMVVKPLKWVQTPGSVIVPTIKIVGYGFGGYHSPRIHPWDQAILCVIINGFNHLPALVYFSPDV